MTSLGKIIKNKFAQSKRIRIFGETKLKINDMENTLKHFAEGLKEGDKFIATIRHKTDGSKNMIDQECTVVHNGELRDSLIGKTAGNEIVRIPYNEITEKLKSE